MRAVQLSEYFTGIGAKRLKLVEISNTSRQREFNGIDDLRTKAVLGNSRTEYQARFVYLSDDMESPEAIDYKVTWYDSRENKPHRSPEFRLYYGTRSKPLLEVIEKACVGDLLVIAKRHDGSLLMLIAPRGSTVENQLLSLFGISPGSLDGKSSENRNAACEIRTESDTEQIELGFVQKMILELIGVEVEDTDENHLDRMISLFGGTFPATRIFSGFARESIPQVSPLDDPDAALIAWMEREETLFRTLERHIVAGRLRQGFGDGGDDVDAFVHFSLSVQNRRKSRAGHALENHLEAVFQAVGISYARSHVTENASKPDFLFPGSAEYRSEQFPVPLLTMLGVKSTCKDRWRQVLAEAGRIERKHLLTLEPGISRNQTDEMRSKQLDLVVPSGIHSTYASSQQSWILSLAGFIELVRERQKTAGESRLLLTEMTSPSGHGPRKPKKP